MKEIWKPIKNYENYEISNFGNVRVKIYKTLKQEQINNEYLRVQISKKHFSVHRLVAEAFIPNIENKPQINHKNGIKTDNNVNNLEWATASENMEHRYRILGQKMGKEGKNPYAKAVIQIKEGKIINVFESQISAEKFTGIDHTTISNCCRGKQHTAGGYIWRYK